LVIKNIKVWAIVEKDTNRVYKENYMGLKYLKILSTRKEADEIKVELNATELHGKRSKKKYKVVKLEGKL